MYMRFNPYHGGLLMERLTLEEFRDKYTEAKFWKFDAFTGAVIPLAVTVVDPFGYNQPVPTSLPKFINADIRIASIDSEKTKRRLAITLEAIPEELFTKLKRGENFAYDFSEFTFAKMWERSSQVYMDGWTSVGQVKTSLDNRVGIGSNGWITVSRQGDNCAYVLTMAFTEHNIKKVDLLDAWRYSALRINTQIAYDDDGRIVDIKRLNLRLGLACNGAGLEECVEKYNNPPLPEVCQ